MGFDVDDRLLSPGELLLSIEGRYSSNSGDFGTFVAWLALECWIQGSLAVQAGTAPASKVDILVAVAVEAQKRFDTAIDYLHGAHGTTINRFEMLAIMRDLDEPDTTAAINVYIADYVYPEMAKTVLGNETGGDGHSIILDDRTASDLINTMLSLGTFYRDRDRYDSDEKRELHDHAMDILAKLSGVVSSI